MTSSFSMSTKNSSSPPQKSSGLPNFDGFICPNEFLRRMAICTKSQASVYGWIISKTYLKCCPVSIATLQALTGMSKSSVCRAAAELERRGWLHRDRRKTESGRSLATMFSVVMEGEIVNSCKCPTGDTCPREDTPHDLKDRDALTASLDKVKEVYRHTFKKNPTRTVIKALRKMVEADGVQETIDVLKDCQLYSHNVGSPAHYLITARNNKHRQLQGASK